jgi:DNA-directed RNA polymerase specialized sigma24 family protein
MSVRTDADLVLAAQAGDVASFEILYARYAPVVHSILLGRLSPADADDVTQNAARAGCIRRMDRAHGPQCRGGPSAADDGHSGDRC